MAPSKKFTMGVVGLLMLGMVRGQQSDSQSTSPVVSESESNSPVINPSDSESTSPVNAVIPSDSESTSPVNAVIPSDSESSSPATNPPPADSDSESPAQPVLPSPAATASPSVSPKTGVDLNGQTTNIIVGGGTGFGESLVWTIPTLDVAQPLSFLFDCTSMSSGTFELLQWQNSVGQTVGQGGQCTSITVSYANCENFDVPLVPTCQQNGAGAGTASITIQLRVTPSVSQSEQTTSPSRSPQTPSKSQSPQTPSPLPSRFRTSRKSPNRYSKAISRASKGAEYKSRGPISRMAKNSPNRKPDHGKDDDHKNGGNNNNNNNNNNKNNDNKKDDKKKDNKNNGKEDKKKEKKNREAVDTMSAAAPEYSATSTDSSNSAYYAFLAIIPVAAGLAGFIWWRARRTPMETVELEYIPKV